MTPPGEVRERLLMVAVTLAREQGARPTRLRSSDRLRFDVANRTNFLKSDVSHGYVQFDMPVPPCVSRNTLHYGEECYVELWRVER